MRYLLIALLLLFAGLLASRDSQAHAQDPDPTATSLGLTPENRALPPWKKPDDATQLDLSNKIRELRQGVLLVGIPNQGLGTAFVISREHRLAATNAHVADMFHAGKPMVAVVNESAQVHKVEKVWYHPGVIRHIAGSSDLVARSPDPSHGPVFSACPDVAVIQLEANGQDLPVEFPLATPDEIVDLFALAVGMCGFPDHSTQRWPALGEQVQATFHNGVVSRVTDFDLNASARDDRLQFLQHTMPNWFGFSGSPLILPNGHAVAVNNSMRRAVRQGFQVNIAHAVRIDCLWELLAFHGLDRLVPLPVEKSTLDLSRYDSVDPRLEQFKRVTRLAAEAYQLIEVDLKFAEGAAKCKEGLRLAPNYAEFEYLRSIAHRKYVFHYHRRIAKQTSLTQLASARAAIERYMRLAPTDPKGLVAWAKVINNTAFLTGDKSEFHKVLSVGNKQLGNKDLSKALAAEAHSLRALAYSNLGHNDRALDEWNTAVSLDPRNPSLWEGRGDYWKNLGYRDRADADARRAREVRRQLTEGNN